MLIVEEVIWGHLNLSIFVQGWLVMLDGLSKVCVEDSFCKKAQIEHFLCP
jgi:hypothetical protein